MPFSLVVRSSGKLEGQKLEIKLAQFLIGRDPQCHLRPASPLISKRHCVLTQRDGKAFIRDFDSTNGSFINDQPVQGEAELHNGDSLKIGPLLFEVQLDSTPAPVNRPTPPPPTRSAPPTSMMPSSQTPAPPATKKPAAPAAPASAVGKKPAAAPAATEQKAAPPARPSAPAATSKPDSSSASGGNEDEDIAALLLDQDDGAPPTPLGASSVEVPEGSTVHEMIVPPEVADKLNKNAKEKEKDKKSASGNTASAAKSILEMYMKRPRT
jgi:predicted component of type VI protein secretion system